MITVFGTVCLDHIVRLPRLPQPGRYEEALSELTVLGGEAANTAAALKKWGADVTLIGNPAGCDADGRTLIAQMASYGFPIPETVWTYRTPVCEVYVADDGERTMIGRGFSNLHKHTMTFEQLPDSGWFTADPNLGSLARDAVRAAYRKRLDVYLMDFIASGDEPILDGCRIWQSSTDWAGQPGNLELNLETVRAHSAKHSCISILTDGHSPISLGQNGQARSIPTFPAPKVVDATGAGDAFRAGMLYGLDLGWALDDCVRFGAAAGALKCGGLGAIGGLPAKNEIEALTEQARQP